MNHQIKRIRLSAGLIALLSGITITEATLAHSYAGYPGRTQGFSFGIGAGVKFLNLKNIITKTTSAAVPVVTRSHDGMANTASPVIGIYARQYMPNLTFLPTFWGVEFNYLTQMRKRNIYASMNLPGGTLDSGYQYRERWDARAMFGAQLLNAGQVDFWAQAGLQVTNFDYEGITTEVASVEQRFKMDNNYALAPAIGLEARFSNPGLIGNGVVTDFILGWTAGYRNAFAVMGTAASTNSFNFGMSANWSHTIGIKIMFRY